MCRSIKTLRTESGAASPDEIEAAALQFVRKVSGFRHPSKANEEAFTRAVRSITEVSQELLTALPPKKPAPAAKDGQ
ncbi:MAG: DUF2277 domain-containing protein [Actinomycetota bacterium]|nr:DUF2277 domain-containing protein [Actinomycetota bacterium]